jgi:hypothetical protein
MPRGNKKRGKKPNNKSGGRMVNITGPGGFELRFPIPRIPSWLGAENRLAANAAIYPRVDLDFPIAVTTVAVVAGACATVLAVDVSALVPNWSSRVLNLFREYCVVGLRLENTLVVSTTPQGLLIVFVDETSAVAPNAGSMFTPHMEVPIVANPTGRTQLLDYMPSGSYTDLEWTPTSAAVTRQWVKYFAAAAQTGTAGGTAGTIMVRGTIAIAFRGYQNF